MRLIQILIDEGKILAHDVARYLHIAELEEKLRALRGGESSRSFREKRARKPVKSAKNAVFAEVAATRKLQGQYIAHLRKFPSRHGKFQKIARMKSREEAIAATKNGWQLESATRSLKPSTGTIFSER
jgi:hypothetical protein